MKFEFVFMLLVNPLWWNYWVYLFVYLATVFICCVVVITQLESDSGIHGKVSSNHGRHPSSILICTNWCKEETNWYDYLVVTIIIIIFIFPQSTLIIILKRHHHHLHDDSKCTDYNTQTEGGRTWQPFVGSKNGNENFRQTRIYNFLRQMRRYCVICKINSVKYAICTM